MNEFHSFRRAERATVARWFFIGTFLVITSYSIHYTKLYDMPEVLNAIVKSFEAGDLKAARMAQERRNNFV